MYDTQWCDILQKKKKDGEKEPVLVSWYFETALNYTGFYQGYKRTFYLLAIFHTTQQTTQNIFYYSTVKIYHIKMNTTHDF